ncbi:SRPBCC family protein [Parapedobacter sp. DT-150]|uniref:SRPBCC family protein n=1 Tax=Parapedobacter sp. DT-150 TaxID=3396162 RepID=UPI003F19C476
METTPLIVERIYDAPIERVWRALTDNDQMKAWYFDIADFKPEPGFEFSFTGGDENNQYLHRCQVVEADPLHRLSYTWAYEGYPGQSLVTFELEALAQRKTKLTLTHGGLDTFPADNKHLAPSSFDEGWTFILSESLRNFVETEPFSRSMAITASIEEVWPILLNPNGQWGNAFGEGALLNDTDWQVGSRVIWTDLEGNVGATGRVTTNNKRDLLEMRYYDDLHLAPDAQLGEYIERFRLAQNEAGQTVLTIDIQGLPKMHIPMHQEMWERALQLIKKAAES